MAVRSLKAVALGVGLTLLASLASAGEAEGQASRASDAPSTHPATDVLPVLMYDTDVGVGYGAKLFALNHAQRGESLDAIVFNSTKGQRWARLLLSLPDFERRQGTVYPVSVDAYADYDARIKASFFGIGSQAKQADRETYRREALDLRATLGRRSSSSLVAQVGLRYRVIKHSEFADEGQLAAVTPDPSDATASWTSLRASVRHDTRDSFVNPTRGIVLEGEGEVAAAALSSGPGMARYGVWSRAYVPALRGHVVVAVRAGVEGVGGDRLPVQALVTMGGAGTVRGMSQDRYVDRVRGLGNVEARFPVYHRLRGIVGMDAGTVWSSVGDISLRGWHTSPAVGLRYHLDTFIVRLDVGLGDETTGVYFNFGQLF
jgi:outer membrane protein assembly factor BamA